MPASARALINADAKKELLGERIVGANLNGSERARFSNPRRVDLRGKRVLLRVDLNVPMADGETGAPARAVPIDAVGPDEMILDVGPRTVEHLISVLARVETLVWNGPLGAFEVEPFDIGTDD
jgi:3-phosphoglycerate kinase